MNTMEFIRSDKGFKAVQDILQAPLGNIGKSLESMLPFLQGPGILRKALDNAALPTSPIQLSPKEIREAKLSLDAFLETPLDKTTLLISDKRGCIQELINLRLREGLTHE